MKSILTTIGIAVLLSGCAPNRTDETCEWINTHERPITCICGGDNGFGERWYTLIDANGIVYDAGRTDLVLPDTIR